MHRLIPALTLLVLAPRLAHAAEASAFESRRTAIYGELGLGAPLGLVAWSSNTRSHRTRP